MNFCSDPVFGKFKFFSELCYFLITPETIWAKLTINFIARLRDVV